MDLAILGQGRVVGENVLVAQHRQHIGEHGREVLRRLSGLVAPARLVGQPYQVLLIQAAVAQADREDGGLLADSRLDRVAIRAHARSVFTIGHDDQRSVPNRLGRGRHTDRLDDGVVERCAGLVLHTLVYEVYHVQQPIAVIREWYFVILVDDLRISADPLVHTDERAAIALVARSKEVIEKLVGRALSRLDGRAGQRLVHVNHDAERDLRPRVGLHTRRGRSSDGGPILYNLEVAGGQIGNGHAVPVAHTHPEAGSGEVRPVDLVDRHDEVADLSLGMVRKQPRAGEREQSAKKRQADNTAGSVRREPVHHLLLRAR